jgi:hypothetical protein
MQHRAPSPGVTNGIVERVKKRLSYELVVIAEVKLVEVALERFAGDAVEHGCSRR